MAKMRRQLGPIRKVENSDRLEREGKTFEISEKEDHAGHRA